MARVLTYTPAVHRRIVDALRRGAPLRDAVGFAGAEWPSFCRWLRAGRRYIEHGPESEGADVRFVELARDVDQAAHESRVALLGLVRRQAEGTPGKRKTKTRPATPPSPGDWRAAEFLLKFQADAPLRRAQLRKARLEAKVLSKRLDGTLPAEKSEIAGVNGTPLIPDPTDLAARIAAIVARAARRAERRDPGDDDADGAG